MNNKIKNRNPSFPERSFDPRAFGTALHPDRWEDP